MRTANLPRRQAYTLIEIMCVVAIIVIAATLAVPMWQSMMADARLTAAGDQVRARLADARAKAMDSGVPWKLAYIPNTGIYQMAPEDSPEWATPPDPSPDQPPIKTESLIRDQLPQDIIMAPNQNDIQGSTDAPSAGGEWKTLGVYLYAGDAREDVTTYFGKAGLVPMRVRLRGMTGVVTVEVPREVKDQP